jgi:hypothetical protein
MVLHVNPLSDMFMWEMGGSSLAPGKTCQQTAFNVSILAYI